MPTYHLRTQAIYAYIHRCLAKDDLSPTMREIAHACQIPLTAVFRHLDWLQVQGYISRDHTVRSIRPLKPLLSDEDQVYKCLVQGVKETHLAPSLNHLRQTSGLSFARIKVALRHLEQAGQICADATDPHLFYPIEVDQKS